MLVKNQSVFKNIFLYQF